MEAARTHWWVRGMQEVADALLAGSDVPLSVLDAGCGVGANQEWLANLAGSGPVTAVDAAPAAIAGCRFSSLPAALVQASVASLPFASASFDLVWCADVLQHLPPTQARTALVEFRRVLSSDGRLLIRTNAAFGRTHIEHQDDWRLYTPADLLRCLSSAAFRVERLTPVNFVNAVWASLPRLFGPRRVPADPGSADHQGGGLGIPEPGSARAAAVWLRIVKAEARWLRRPGRRLPFGHSLLALARPDPRLDGDA